MSNKGTAGKRKYVKPMIPSKLEIIRKLESGESKAWF
jgi:hypothetical protein